MRAKICIQPIDNRAVTTNMLIIAQIPLIHNIQLKLISRKGKVCKDVINKDPMKLNIQSRPIILIRIMIS